MVNKGLILILCLTFFSCIYGKPECNDSDIFKRIKSEDCKTLWICFRDGIEPLRLLQCREGQVVGKNSRCVPKGSELDTCAIKDTCGLAKNPCRNDGRCVKGLLPNTFDCECRKPFTGRYCEIEPTIQAKCSAFGPAARVFDPEWCQTYFDCSDIDSKTKKPRRKECGYPFQFDAEAGRCRYYSGVNCGYRKVVKSKCQYLKYQARSYDFSSCEMYYPSCERKPNGIQPHSLRKQSPWYMVCKDQRLVKTGFCPHKNNQRQIATKDGCKGVFEVPEKEGGLLPDCTGKPAGYYPLQGGSCRQFFLCEKDITYIKECPKGLVFDKTNKRCTLKYFVCRPCGTRKCPSS